MSDWKINSEVTGGILFTFNAKLKRDGKTISFKWKRNRQPDLAPNGLEWMKYWAKRKNKELPNSGYCWSNPKIFRELTRAAGFETWDADCLRHSFTSYAHHNKKWQVAEDYWHRACGHSPEMFQTHYERVMSQNDCDRYFKILPPGSGSNKKRRGLTFSSPLKSI